MLPLNGKSRWMSAVILFFGILLKNGICQSSGTNKKQKNVLFVSAKQLDAGFKFPSEVVYRSNGGLKLCFNVNRHNTQAACCGARDFKCSFDIKDLLRDKYSLILDSKTLLTQDIVLMTQPEDSYDCMPSKFYSKPSGFLLNLHHCLNMGVHNIRLSQNNIGVNCSQSVGDACREKQFNLTVGPKTERHCEWTCKPQGNNSSSSTPSTSSTSLSTSSPSSSTSTSSPSTSSTSPSPPSTSPSTSSPSTSSTSPSPPSTSPSTSSPSTSTSTSSPSTSSTSPSPPSTSTSTSSPSTSTSSPSTSSTSPSTSSPSTSSTSPSTSSPSTSSTSPSTSSPSTSTSSPSTSTSTSSPSTSSTSPSTSSPSTSISSPSTSSSTSSPPVSIAIPHSVNNGSSLENAANIMNNLSVLLERLGDSTTADLTVGDIKGLITRLPSKEQSSINIGVTTSKDVKILGNNTNLEKGYSRLVRIPKEASEMAIKRNGSFAAVLVFPGMRQDDPSSTFLNDEVIGIEMGTVISNLSQTIDIQYSNVDKNGSIASCRSWDGRGKEVNWITDGCQTNEKNDSITCRCSHLTFFAILMSPVPQNISSSDFTALTYITSIGCGMSMFFLAVGLFMHCLIRKGKASEATKILINLFVAMFTLNLSFLINESIANMGNFGACVAMAATMHYTMLATFTWFFMEALHLYFNMWKLSIEMKHYMTKIYVTGWGTPAVVVIGLLASGKYDYLVIHTDNGSSAKMCWISDAALHQGVNIGYYVIVFIFTITVFLITVRQIVILKPTAEKAQNMSSIKTNSFSIIGLVLLLGITWAFAFFSHGPLLIPSYYIFTILNSFQGFFLFIYYYNSSKMAKEDKNAAVNSSSTTTSNIAMTSPSP